jgi:outer membrane protein TolC
MMATRLSFVAVLLTALTAAGPAAAQEGPSRPDTTATVPCRPSDDCPTLTLDAFLTTVLRTSPQARSLRLASDRAAARLLEARGSLDPRFVSGYEYKTQADKAKLDVLRSGLRQPLNLPMAPTLKVDYRRGLGSSIDPSVVTSPVGETRVGVSFSPLQGLFANKRRATLDKARLAPRRADAQQAKARNALLRDAALAFWDWVGARQKLTIARDLLALARRRQALVTRRARAGEAPAIDSIEAAQTTASRQGTVADAVQAARQKRIALTTFLGGRDGAADTFRYAPPPLPADPPVDTLHVAAAVDTALARRPALRALAVKQRQARIERDLAQGRRWPDLKLEAQAVSYDESPFNVTDVKVGVEIEQPLLFRQGRGEAERARIKTRQLGFERDRTEQKVRADVEKAVVALRQARRRVRTARRSVNLARRLQAAEQRRFEAGEGTLFRLNQREQSLAEAREQRVTAQVDVLRALATYRWATGTIGDTYGAARP